MKRDIGDELLEFVNAIYSKDPKYKKLFPQIESIEIDSSKNKIVLNLSGLMGLFVGKKGVNVISVENEIREKFGTEWSLSAEGPPNVVNGSGQRADRPYQDKRSIIFRQGLPATIPFSKLGDGKAINQYSKHIDTEGPILVTLFRDTMRESENTLLTEVIGNMGKRQLNFALQVMEKFPGKKIKLFNWPEIMRSGKDIKRSTHPYISHRCRAAAIVFKNSEEIDDETIFQDALFEAVHRDTIKESENKWVLLGDETGTLDEFNSKGNQSTETKSTMCWVAIPPSTNIEALSTDFHCSGSKGSQNYLQALANLSKHQSILYFTFDFEEGEIIDSASEIGGDPHLSFWQDSLPLVLESIANEVKGKTKIDIFVEQAMGLESGIGVITPIIAELTTAFKNRKNWKNLQFDQLWVVSKGEHPWMGYPDAIGANINRKKFKVMKNKNQKVLDQVIYDKIFQSPYRQSSLNGSVRQALKETARPLSFLKFLYEISEEDMRDYIKPFLSSAIDDSVSALGQGDWQKLLEHMEINSSSKQGQSASGLIHGFVNIDSEINKLSQDKDRFDFALAMLGTSNHIGARDQAAKCIGICNEILKNGYKPRKNREIKFKNLQGGVKDNQFDFSHIDEDLVLPTDSEFDEEWNHYLGAQAISRALKSDGFEFANEIEDYLLRNTTDFDHLKRRWIMRAELQFEVGDYGGAMSALEIRLPEAIDSSVNDLLIDGYYLASFLKGCTLSERPKSEFTKLSSAITSSLNKRHPSQRIAYWCLRWANQVGTGGSDIAIKCKDHLIELKNEPLFTHDAPGVILACELLDLESKGLSFTDTESFMELVLANSAETTREWVASNPPNEDDWLAPLNFNYR